MKNETKQTFAQGARRVLRGQGCCLLVVRSVVWCVQLVDNRNTTKNARRKTSKDEGRDKAEKNKTRPQRGDGFLLNLYLPGISRWSRVISHDLLSRYIVISYEVSHIMRYHKIWYIEILYPYPEFLGLISRYRIPWKYFSIPNTLFCPVKCTKFGEPRE